MIERLKYAAVLQSLHTFPVTALLGPRQVGKTTLAKQLAGHYGGPTIYLDLELPSDLNKLQSPELYLREHGDALIIIDEIQRKPELFALLRALVDQDRRPGRFMILGSASPDLMRHASESLAGRVVYHELPPLCLTETGSDSIRRLWLRGGYPNSFLAGTDQESHQWRLAFIATYLERDIPQLGVRIPAAQLGRFWTMLAHMNGQLWNASHISASMGLSSTTVRHYLDVLEDTFIVRQLKPWFANTGKRLTKAPKIYLRDTGLLHSLLQLGTEDLLMSHPGVGNSWEGFVIEQILASLPDSYQPFFYRTNAGAEIDMILTDGEKKIAVEVKFSATPKVAKGFWLAFKDLGCHKGYVVYPGRDRYPIGEGVEALPAVELSKIVNQ
jgi:predicted AAA+ superfamily ATPase